MQVNKGLVGHWPFADDCEDHSGSRLSGQPVNIELGAKGPDGQIGSAARFDGLESHLAVADRPALHLGTADFSIAAWVLSEEKYGDLLSKFDAENRRGITLRIAGSSPGYNSVSDVRALHFGIDNGVLEPWVDHGKPWPSNTLISTLTVHRGDLYTGIADASGPPDSPAVFRFHGGSEWEHCGRLEVDARTRSVQSLIVHQGQLYAGTGNWNWDRANAESCGPTQVFRYEGDGRWHDCGQFGHGFRVLSLASFHGHLYAGDDTGKVYRLEEDGEWIFCGQLGAHNRVNAMMVFQDRLYGAPHGAIFRYDGDTKWTCVGAGNDPGEDLLFGETQTHTLQVYDSHLWAGMWPQGKVLRYEGGENPGNWTDCGQLGISTEKYRINEINDLTVYNGKLYAGVIPQGEVYRYERDGEWTLITRLVNNEQMDPKDIYSWNRVPCLTVFRGRLFAGTSTCHGIASDNPHPQVGRVYSMEAGRNVSFDDDLGSTWRHIAAVRQSGRLKLYVDGKPVGVSEPFSDDQFDLSNSEPLLIGLGTQSHLRGLMSDVRLYGRAIEESEIATLAGV